MKKFFITESDRNQIKSLYQTKGLLNEEYGDLVWDSGKKYLGEYIKDSEGYGFPEGYGTMTYENNFGVHVGYFKNGEASGYGTYTKSNGDVYEGNWENDELNGYGTCKWNSGEHYEGNWVNGKLTGYGTYTNVDGTVEQGNWREGVFLDAEESSEESEEESTEDCEELRELATAESLYNICNLQSGTVVIGLRNQGPLVKYIQCILNQQEDELAELVLDGIFGPKTKEKVEKFQQNNEGLTVDGIVGEKTFEKFNLSPEC